MSDGAICGNIGSSTAGLGSGPRTSAVWAFIRPYAEYRIMPSGKGGVGAGALGAGAGPVPNLIFSA